MKPVACILAVGTILAMATGLRSADVSRIEINGFIGPATASYVSRAIQVAAERQDACLIVQLNTPGGSVKSMEDITDSFNASPVPIVVYVSPSHAAASSAGTFITLAADVAAMAPFSRIGAAHPVGMSGEGDTNSVMWTKAENDLATTIIGLANDHKRNAEWAESAVRKSDSLTAEQALDLNVIDLIAVDLPDLLRQLDSREVDGRKLNIAGAKVVQIKRSIGEELFQMLWHPQVMMLLMLVAVYGIIGEINHPGAIFPGVIGVIALVLFLYMATILPVNAAGVALIVVAIILFAIDVFAPTHGVLTVGGIIAFFLGAMLLFNRAGPAFRLSLPWIIFATALTALFFLFIAGLGLRAQRLPIRAGKETMFGKTIPAIAAIDATSGKVFVEGEYWNAVSETPVAAGQEVEIIGIDGLTLKVKPLAR